MGAKAKVLMLLMVWKPFSLTKNRAKCEIFARSSDKQTIDALLE